MMGRRNKVAKESFQAIPRTLPANRLVDLQLLLLDVHELGEQGVQSRCRMRMRLVRLTPMLDLLRLRYGGSGVELVWLQIA